MALFKFASQTRREQSLASVIPITSHVAPTVARTRAGHYVQTLRVSGASFESADDEDLNNWHLRLNVLWRNLASPHVALWTHIVRERDRSYPQGQFDIPFAAGLDAKYREKMAGETLMRNQLFVSVVYQPQVGRIGSAALGLMKKADATAAAAEIKDSLDLCAKLLRQLTDGLARYDVEVLGIYTDAKGRMCSSLMEFYGYLVNGTWSRMVLPRGPLNEAVGAVRPLIGTETIEFRSATSTRYAAMVGIKEYPTPTPPGVLNTLLTAPFPLVLSQSFTFIPKPTALNLIQRQIRRMNASGDLAASQQAELHDALDDLTSNRFVMGDHHFTLQVRGEAFEGTAAAATEQRIKHLNDNVSAALVMLGDTGMVAVREDAALEASFLAQLPGNFSFRPRKAPITSRNFAAFAPMHNYPSGRAWGNHWGQALMTLSTSAQSPYFMSLHASDPRLPDGGTRKDVGHMIGFGPTGGGKTVLLGFAICRATQFGARQVVFDVNEGLHILVRALGGPYLPFKNGRPTGSNPLLLDPTPGNIEFLRRWLRRLARRTPGEVLTVRHEAELDAALRGTMQLPQPTRRLSRLVEFLPDTDPEGMHARLARWTVEGDYGWVFDNEADDVVPLLASGAPIIGFDVTDLLANDIVRDPAAMYLLHLVEQMLDGSRFICWMDEFNSFLQDEASFEPFAEKALEKWRKREGVFSSFTQSVSHALRSKIARAIIEQTPTKIFLPNPEADYVEYTEGLSLTDREFNLIKTELEPGSRMMLVKQGHVSVVCKLDLKGFDYELAVISGTSSNVALMHELIALHGESPDAWLPHFREAVATRRLLASTKPPPSFDADLASLPALTLTSKDQRHAA